MNKNPKYSKFNICIETFYCGLGLYLLPNLTGLLRKSYKKWGLRKPLPYKNNSYLIISILRVLFYDPIFYIIPLPAKIPSNLDLTELN